MKCWFVFAYSKCRFLEELAKHGADVNAVDEFGNTALMIAASDNDLETTKCLVKLGAKTEIQNRKRQGQTALHLAVSKGHVQIVRCLLENGADPNAQKNSSVGGALCSSVFTNLN